MSGELIATMRPLPIAALALLVAGAVYVFLFVGRREKNMPPGPPTIPVSVHPHPLP